MLVSQQFHIHVQEKRKDEKGTNSQRNKKLDTTKPYKKRLILQVSKEKYT
jgi:hypothetical protein